ncbi:FtsX-like permease family protein [Myxococcota bacterium]
MDRFTLQPQPTLLEAFWRALGVWGQASLVGGLAMLVLLWLVLAELRPLRGRSAGRWGCAMFTWTVIAALVGTVVVLATPRFPLGLRAGLFLPGFWLALFALWGLLRALRTEKGRRWLLRGLTLVCLVAFVGLSLWTWRLPADRASVFVLWHQLVRIGAATSGTGLLLGLMLMGLPRILDLLEGWKFTQFVAVRHVRAHKSGFLTAISFLCIAGVWVSSWALCNVVSIMGGFGADLKRKILGNNAHVMVETRDPGGFDNWRDTVDRVRITPGVFAASPVAAGEAMASSRTNTAGVRLRGIDTSTIGQVIDVFRNIEVGKAKYLEDARTLAELPEHEVIWLGPGGQQILKGPPLRKLDEDEAVRKAVRLADDYPGIVVGRELAKQLHVYVADEITLISPLGDLGPMGVLPRSRRFRVAAIFYSGMYEYDASQAYVKLEAAQEFLDLGHKVTAIEARLDDARAVAEVAPRVASAVDRPDVQVRHWQEMNKQLFSALELEKIAMFVILSIAIAVASFCIICTLLLMVTEKSKEIAILKALGASDRAVLWVFMLEGIIIGAMGTVLGVVTGLATTLGIKYSGVRLNPEVYYVDRLPVSVEPSDFALVALAAMVITTLATVYPALAASRLRPVEGIRYE